MAIIIRSMTGTKPIYIFCPECGNKAWRVDDHKWHVKDSPIDSVNIGGVFVVKDFITKEEQDRLVSVIDLRKPWVPSQEGRAKQDYGPKVSFLKKKVSVGNFDGFPSFAIKVFNKMKKDYPNRLDDFKPVEFCILEYTPERGSYIRPHFDDKWIWGDRLITVNLLSETALRLTREYNIPPYEIVIKMPARSLVIIHGEARYDWHHSISRYDIRARRIAMTWRELSEEFMQEEEHKEFVSEVLAIANKLGK